MKRARFMPVGLLAIVADSWGVEFDCMAKACEPFEAHGEFAVVAINGPLMHHTTWFWDSYEAIASRVDAALASHLPALMLKISSPGGQVSGCFELAEDIRAKAKAAGKRVVAYVDGMAASAAYALACAAESIFVPTTGLVGSIGCMQVAIDATAADRAMGLGFEIFSSGIRKTDGNPHIALNDGARTSLQAQVDDMAVTFFAEVARARALDPSNVEQLEGAMFVGAKAKAMGLADEVKTFAEVVASGGQINAQQPGAEAVMTEEEKKARAALQAIADGDDEKAAARAKKALAAYAEGDDDDAPPSSKKDDDKKSDAKAEGDDDDAPPSSKKDDDKKSDAKAEGDDDKKAQAKAASPAMQLAASVQSLVAWKEQQEETLERAKLMAKRPDFAPEVVAFLAGESLETVRNAVKTFPRGTAAKGQVNAARAALEVRATTGAGAGEPVGLQGSQAEELDKLMGIAPVNAKHEPHVSNGALVLPTVPPSIFRQRAEAARIAANAGKAGK